ncbi:hypothetical protein LDENG_00046820 [Lucifuga dentata]|nr:hypothetical protein LDENG_00046820 [Lucifuga dentata]
MDFKDSLMKGGVLIRHNIYKGKHHYEVENVVKFKKTNGKKPFMRKGDKLILLNDINLQDVTPEVLAQALTEGNPMLTVHKPNHQSPSKEQPEESCPAEDTFHPVSKEALVLSFTLEMRREEDLGENETKEREDMDDVEEVSPAENGEKEQGRDLLFVSMVKTSISEVAGRSCDTGGPCHHCSGTKCTINDFVMMSESRMVTLVPRGCDTFKKEKQLNEVALKHAASHQYLRAFSLQSSLYVSPNPEKMTIYYYKPEYGHGMDMTFRGVPVVLNFTDSNCFLRCCKDGERVLLKVETCEKQRLMQISKSDEYALSFVFYMKTHGTKQRKFESALHLGWFIHIVNTDTDTEVGITTLERHAEEVAFVIIIQK